MNMLLIKTITSVLKILTYIISIITAHAVRLAAILVVMFVSTFTTAVILHLTKERQENITIRYAILSFF